MKGKVSFSDYFVIGVMLFALFFGAGNLIFPASLGQHAGTNLAPATLGFLITGTGLPLLGILTMGFSGSRNLQELAGRVHPVYGIIFTALLYLTIGPFFAGPRTGAVAYDIGIAPLVGDAYSGIGLFLFTLIFFAVTMWLSLNPSKIVDTVGKILSPGIIILLAVLLIAVIVKPMGGLQAPEATYHSGAFMTGFMEGYNTMDALASLVFGIIVIQAIRRLGVTAKGGILAVSVKSGIVAIFFLSIIYAGIAYLGATSTGTLGLFDTGGPVLSLTSDHYFGLFGAIMLTVIIILACLTTSIGLITACGEYFHSLFPAFSYKTLVVFFSLLSFVVANFGLENIITFSFPVLMLLYPPAIMLMLLTFCAPLFRQSRLVYMSVTVVTLLISIADGLVTLFDTLDKPLYGWLEAVIRFYEKFLPMYGQGLGWLVPAVVVMLVTGLIARLASPPKPAV